MATAVSPPLSTATTRRKRGPEELTPGLSGRRLPVSASKRTALRTVPRTFQLTHEQALANANELQELRHREVMQQQGVEALQRSLLQQQATLDERTRFVRVLLQRLDQSQNHVAELQQQLLSCEKQQRDFMAQLGLYLSGPGPAEPYQSERFDQQPHYG